MLEESVSAIPSSIWASMNSWFTPTVLFVILNLMIGTIALTSTFSNPKNPSQNEQPRFVTRSPSVLHRLKSLNFYSHHNRSQDPQKSNPDPETDPHYFFPEAASQQNVQIFEHKQQNDVVFQQNHDFDQTHESNHHKTQTQIVSQQNESNPDEFPHTHESNIHGSQNDVVFERNDEFRQGHELESVEEDEMQSMDEVYSQLKGSHFSRTKSDTEPSSGKIPAKLPEKMKKSASMKSPFGHFQEEDIVETRRPATVRERGSAKATDDDEEVDAKADDFINKFKQQLKLQRLDSIIRYKDMIGRGSGR
ncbi:hypothetical protein BUALT_Bualt05G0011800 [Buddleja alternifolia]|uniref:DUF4408 domain-containing protein n=1 Tax=Buddleja alternifolia TaxID=168488 RepID=A0AAV6XP56_9LAMI|nr:hypothetical protein BUALT_Bualt05G0011800 [Buddleja alternifolia]